MINFIEHLVEISGESLSSWEVKEGRAKEVSEENKRLLRPIAEEAFDAAEKRLRPLMLRLARPRRRSRARRPTRTRPRARPRRGAGGPGTPRRRASPRGARGPSAPATAGGPRPAGGARASVSRRSGGRGARDLREAREHGPRHLQAVRREAEERAEGALQRRRDVRVRVAAARAVHHRRAVLRREHPDLDARRRPQAQGDARPRLRRRHGARRRQRDVHGLDRAVLLPLRAPRLGDVFDVRRRRRGRRVRRGAPVLRIPAPGARRGARREHHRGFLGTFRNVEDGTWGLR